MQHNNNNNMITKSFELVDTTIQDVRNTKETLTSTMDLINSLMREVECKEKVAEQAKQEAASSSLDIAAKADKLRQLQRQAKETNDMRAREVHGQKGVLVQDLEDLGSRVSSVLNEGGKSVGVLDQMCKALKERLTMALIEKEFADREKLEKESYAGKALAYEISKMQKEVEKFGRLTREAPKISKFQKSLKDREQMVDVLRGDISDQCEQVNLLKDLFDSEMCKSCAEALMCVSEDMELE